MPKTGLIEPGDFSATWTSRIFERIITRRAMATAFIEAAGAPFGRPRAREDPHRAEGPARAVIPDSGVKPRWRASVRRGIAWMRQVLSPPAPDEGVRKLPVVAGARGRAVSRERPLSEE